MRLLAEDEGGTAAEGRAEREAVAILKFTGTVWVEAESVQVGTVWSFEVDDVGGVFSVDVVGVGASAS